MKKLTLLFTFFLLYSNAAAGSIEKLADKLQNGLKTDTQLKIAVLEFNYTDGRNSQGPIIIQERLTTILAQNKNLTIIERNLLKKIMGELKLEASGAIDATTAKKIGKLLGVDAIASGTLNDLKNSQTEINARIIETESAKILSAASAIIEKTWKDTSSSIADNPNNADYDGKSLVQIAILLDTSSSMDGLINQTKNQLWSIINELTSSEKDGDNPIVQVAVYEYGNSLLSKDAGFIRQVLPFTRDLDEVAEELFALKTNGGSEYCGETINKAVKNLQWSKKDDAYKVIFIAGNEAFTQGAVDFRQAISNAKNKGIFVNTIFCGTKQAGIAMQWKTAAELAMSEYTNINQTASVAQIDTPQDIELSKLNSRLNTTYLAYGSGGAKAIKRKNRLDTLSAPAGASVMSERIFSKAQESEAISSWDLISAIETGKIEQKDIKTEQLPEELKKMSEKEREKHIENKLAERKKVKAEILKLQNERKKYIAEREKEMLSAPSTMGKAVINAIHKQASKKGFKFK
ncbi:MAG: VWA domain-containing protein [Elusimicrobia bacterium]|nr:VWA domain-containing protein [Elusimicrobiota bacterium]